MEAKKIDTLKIQTEPDLPVHVAPEILEEIKALFLDEDFLREAPRKLYRVDGKDRRYYTVNEAGIQWYLSVTTAIDSALKQSPHLIKWIADKGYEEAEQYKQDAAEYGTFMHAQIASFLIQKAYDLDRVEEILEAWIQKEKPQADTADWPARLRSDLPAFAQFAHDYKLKPLAIELVLASDELQLAGAIDMVAKITVEVDAWSETEVYKSGPNKGQPKKIKAELEMLVMVDFKSGRKGFSEANEIQLHAYRKIWDENFPDMPIERLYNWSPKEWRTAPSYNFTEQTEKESKYKLPHLLALAGLTLNLKPSVRIQTSGLLTLGDAPEIREIDMDALIMMGLKEKKDGTHQKTEAA